MASNLKVVLFETETGKRVHELVQEKTQEGNLLLAESLIIVIMNSIAFISMLFVSNEQLLLVDKENVISVNITERVATETNLTKDLKTSTPQIFIKKDL